jgi:hypothetical protein
MSENKRQPHSDRNRSSFRVGEESYQEPIRQERKPVTKDESYQEPQRQQPAKESDQK